MKEPEALRKEFYFDKSVKPFGAIACIFGGFAYIFLVHVSFSLILAIFLFCIAIFLFFKKTGKAIIVDIENQILQLENLPLKQNNVIVVPFSSIDKIIVNRSEIFQHFISLPQSIDIVTNDDVIKNIQLWDNEIINLLRKYVQIDYGSKTNEFLITKGLGRMSPWKSIIVLFSSIIIFILFCFLVVEVNLYIMR